MLTKRTWTTSEIRRLIAWHPTCSAPEIASRLSRTVGSVHYKADKLGLKKSSRWIRENARQTSSNPSHGGHATRFTKGQKSWNKGTKFHAGGRCVETQFKPGRRPHTWNPIGHERTTAEGYLERKMTDTGNTRRDYKAAHRLVWEQHNGPIPRGHIVVFINGNPQDRSIQNLDLITRRELMRRNSVHNYPKKMVAVIQLRGALNRKINARENP